MRKKTFSFVTIVCVIELIRISDFEAIRSIRIPMDIQDIQNIRSINSGQIYNSGQNYYS
jgi:hypothetical protein